MVAYMNLDIGKYVHSNIIWTNLRVKSICWTQNTLKIQKIAKTFKKGLSSVAFGSS